MWCTDRLTDRTHAPEPTQTDCTPQLITLSKLLYSTDSDRSSSTPWMNARPPPPPRSTARNSLYALSRRAPHPDSGPERKALAVCGTQALFLCARAPPRRHYRPMSPPMMTSAKDMSVLIECGTTPAVMGNSIGAVLTMRTTLPEPGVSRMAKNGRSRPSSV
jgi:hypothetical protein